MASLHKAARNLAPGPTFQLSTVPTPSTVHRYIQTTTSIKMPSYIVSSCIHRCDIVLITRKGYVQGRRQRRAGSGVCHQHHPQPFHLADILSRAKDHAKSQGGTIEHEYSLIKGFSYASQVCPHTITATDASQGQVRQGLRPDALLARARQGRRGRRRDEDAIRRIYSCMTSNG